MSSSPSRSKFQIRYIVGGIAVFVILGVPLLHVVWSALARHGLNKTLANLHAEGEPVTMEQLRLDDVPAEQNASLDYRAAGESVAVNTASWEKYDNASSDEFVVPLTVEEQAVVQTVLMENIRETALLISARGKSAGGWSDSTLNPTLVTDYYWNCVKNACRLARLNALQADMASDDNGAVDSLMDGLLIADASQNRPTLGGHLAAMSCTNIAAQSISQLAPALRVGEKKIDAR